MFCDKDEMNVDRSSLYIEGPALNTLLEKISVLEVSLETLHRILPVDCQLALSPRHQAGHLPQLSGPDHGHVGLHQQDVDGEDAGLDEEDRGDGHFHLLHVMKKIETRILVFHLQWSLSNLQRNLACHEINLS